jgi:anaerobic magnesium-protoporphyrin IX monomethyl ester cyclase
MREAAFKMQQYGKAAGCKVIVTSSDSADHFENYLQHGADFVIIGEAEYTLLELINNLNKGETTFNNIAGLAFLKQDEIVRTPGRAIKKQLDELPLPAWDLINFKDYRKVWKDKHSYFSINLATTRGCPYKCNWCAKPMYGNAYNMRSPGNVIGEIKYLQQVSGFEHIWFCDDIFGLKRSWVVEFAELIKVENLKFNYKIQSRADLLVQEKYVESLAASGCTEVWLGAESGSQKILDAMDKGTTIEQIKTARKLLMQYGIKASYFLQYGYLGEDMDDIQKTISLVKDTMPDDIGISVSYPLPGTVFYEKVKQDLLFKSNWTDSDELAMMFKNTYPPAFYKILHRLTHSIFRKAKAINLLRHKNTLKIKMKAVLSYLKYSIVGTIQSYRLKQNMNQNG